jgi:LysR family transcriptional regulator, chromosome initiation inhibitor
LGRIRYRPAAARGFAQHWFPDGVTADALAVAPLVDFDRSDELQSRYLRSVTRRRLEPPRHYVPASADFADAIALGLGWGMLPDFQLDARPGVVDLAPGVAIDVPLYWQQWNLRSPLLDAIAAEVIEEARRSLSERRTPRSA